MSSGRPPPLKPWERAGAQTNAGASPFAPSSVIKSTAQAAITATNSGEKPQDGTVGLQQQRTATTANTGIEPRPMPVRPWEVPQQGYGTGYGTGIYNTGMAMSSYNRPFSGYSGTSGYGGGINTGGYSGYGTSPYGGYGGYNSTSPYGGGGMYNRGFGYGMGSPMGGAMTSPMAGAYGNYGGGNPNNPINPNNQNPNDPGPPRAPNFWQAMLSTLHGVMNFFGRLAFLIDENTQAFHFFITALLQLCDRAGVLYGELARFVLRILGFYPRSSSSSKARSVLGRKALAGVETPAAAAAVPAAPAPAAAAPAAVAGGASGGGGVWDNVWSKGGS